MRSHLALTCAIFIAGHSVVSAAGNPPTISNIDAGANLDTSVLTFTDQIDKCYLQTPSGTTIQFKPNDESDEKYELLEDSHLVSQCRVRILNLTTNDNGLWTLNAVNSNGETTSQSYDVTVKPVPEEEELIPEYLPEQASVTTLGGILTFSIPDLGSYASETCRVITPNGQTHDLNEETLVGIELHTSADFACGVKITVSSEDFVGNWTLVARGRRFFSEVEKRLSFGVSVEETVQASPSNITVGEHNNFHISLVYPTSEPETCKLITPHGTEYKDDAETRSNTCAYVVTGVTSKDNGTWTILYGNRITYRAPVEVVVVARAGTSNLTLKWTLHEHVQQTIGPEDAIYCKITDPKGRTAFDGFGRCNITIERVTSEHTGTWRMAVGLHGHVLPEESTFTVAVTYPDPEPTVTTHVEVNEPKLSISCSVESQDQVTTCKFRHPSGRVLLAHEGISQGRYSFHGSRVSYESTTQSHTCGLHITDPTLEDIGFWRCAMETERDIYYGHISVTCPWLLRDPEDAAAIVTEPTLTADRTSVNAVVGEPVTMSCSVQAAIRYCYFRARNGTIYHVAPGQSDVYVGAGFNAGECGIRFPTLAVADSGSWSCHVGLDKTTEPEQRDTISVEIKEALEVLQHDNGESVIINARLNQKGEIDYCVFVRIDGLGFTIDNAPPRYHCLVYPTDGHCELRITEPTILDRHPWTVMAKLRGQGGMTMQVTAMTLMPEHPPTYAFRFPTIWLAVMVVGLCLAMMAAILSPSKNRRWAASRASSVTSSLRDSFRRSFKKPQNNGNTAVAA